MGFPIVDAISIESATKIFSVIITIVASVFIAVLVRWILRKSVRKHFPQYIYVPLERVIIYGIAIVGSILALQPLGLQLTGLLVAGGVVGIVIGFASQTVVSNLLSGIFLFIDKPLKVGDPVEVEGVSGRVIDISIFSTRIRTWDGVLVRIPNEKVFTSIISNFEKNPVRRVVLKVGISYTSDVEKAREAIIKAIEEHPYTLINPPPEVFVDEFGENGIILTVRWWAPSQVWFTTKKELLEKIKKALDEAGIEIPFPQRVVWLKQS